MHVRGRNSAPVACRLLVRIYTREKNQFNIQSGNNRGEFSTPTYLKTHNIITGRRLLYGPRARGVYRAR